MTQSWSKESSNSLGRLERVELRDIWASEASDFTPWLAGDENIVLLGGALGMDLELEAQEKNVGPFRADILCRDTGTGSWVLIENQLEKTDHTHLGQLITYAAGLNAVTIVWVAQRFTEEHRSAIDWLNRITDEDFNFFALEIELWRIGDSLAAPKFNIVSKPNDWSRSVTAAAHRIERGALTETQQMQVDFWTGFRDYLAEHSDRLRPQKAHPQCWMTLSIGRTGFSLAAVFSMTDSEAKSFESQEIRAEFVINDAESHAYFQQLESQKADIEHDFGEELTWYRKDNVRACRIYVRKSVSVADRQKWPDHFAWLGQKLDRLHQTFSSRVKQLSLETE